MHLATTRRSLPASNPAILTPCLRTPVSLAVFTDMPVTQRLQLPTVVRIVLIFNTRRRFATPLVETQSAVVDLILMGLAPVSSKRARPLPFLFARLAGVRRSADNGLLVRVTPRRIGARHALDWRLAARV